MTRKIIFIIVGALLILVLFLLLWFWFLHRAPDSATSQTNGTFATSSDRTAGTQGQQGQDQNQASAYSVEAGQDGYALTSTSGLGALAGGTYAINGTNGIRIGTYRATRTATGHYAFAPSDLSSPTLPTGTYIFILLRTPDTDTTVVGDTGATTTPTTNPENPQDPDSDRGVDDQGCRDADRPAG
jgi:hypothetical protein